MQQVGDYEGTCQSKMIKRQQQLNSSHRQLVHWHDSRTTRRELDCA